MILDLLIVAVIAQAQTTETAKQPPAKPAAAKTSPPPEADPELKERRAKARSLLVALSSDARTFHDQTLRARSLARIADTLWQVDPEQGRLMFRKAWEAAEVADLENEKKLQEEVARQKSITGGSFAINLPPNLRREVLSLTAKHDRAITEEFLEKLKIQKLEAAGSATNLRSVPRQSDALNQRLSVATEALRAGEIDRAIQFADPVLTTITVETVNFLCELREKNPAAADTRYATMLSNAAGNPQADANTVSLLSSYIFTPYFYITFTNSGTSSSQMSSKTAPANVTPELRNTFLQAGAAILLRPLPQPGQDQGTAGLDGRYFVTKRLLPIFEQWATAEMVESIRAQLNALNAVVSDDARRRDDEWIHKGIKPDKPAEDRTEGLLDKIDRAKTSAERDSLYVQLANYAADKGDMRAREFASKIEDSEIRKPFQSYIDGTLALSAVRKKQADQAVEMVHKGDLSQAIKAWVLTQAAKLVAKTDKEKALELVEEAVSEARRIDVSDPDLPRALVAVANALNVIDASRVWDATFDAVKAANSADKFTGEDGGLVLKFQTKHGSSVHTTDAAEFDLNGIFQDLAGKDYDRAVELARGFEAEGPRAVATIAIARAILQPRRK
jgi:hypothetical protein